MTLIELIKLYDAGWMPTIPIDNKYSAALLSGIHRWRPAMATQIFKRKNTEIEVVIITDRPVMSAGFVHGHKC